MAGRRCRTRGCEIGSHDVRSAVTQQGCGQPRPRPTLDQDLHVHPQVHRRHRRRRRSGPVRRCRRRCLVHQRKRPDALKELCEDRGGLPVNSPYAIARCQGTRANKGFEAERLICEGLDDAAFVLSIHATHMNRASWACTSTVPVT